jgi:hypothetical protein
MLSYSNLADSSRETAEKANAGVIVRSLNTYNQLRGTGAAITSTNQLDVTVTENLTLKSTAGNLVDLDLRITADELSGSSVNFNEVLRWVDHNGARWHVRDTKRL